MIAEAQQHKWLRESPGKLATHENNSVRKRFFNVRQTHHAACRELGKFMREANFFFHDLPSAAGPCKTKATASILVANDKREISDVPLLSL